MAIGGFYGSSYFANPRKIVARRSDDQDGCGPDLDLDMVREVRDLWQFFAIVGRKHSYCQTPAGASRMTSGCRGVK